MDNKLTWKSILVVFVILMCGLEMWPPDQRLVRGPDLAGGTVLTYGVEFADDVEEGEKDGIVKTVIDVIRGRLDPTGVRNIQISVETGYRIKIVMPHASKDVRALQDAYRAALDKLETGNITRSEIRRALASLKKDGKRDSLDSLVKGIDARTKLIDDLIAIDKKLSDVQGKIQKLFDDGKVEPGKATENPEWRKLTEEEVEHQSAFGKAMDALMATTVDRTRVGTMLTMSQKRDLDDSRKPVAGSSAREKELARLKDLYSTRIQEIDAVVQAWDTYSDRKQPLDGPDDIKRMLRGQGVLGFRITVDPGSEISEENADRRRKELTEKGPAGQNPAADMRWFRIDDPLKNVEDAVSNEAKSTGKSRKKLFAFYQKQLEEETTNFFRVHGNVVGAKYGDDYYVLLWNVPERRLIHEPGAELQWKLKRASPGQDDTGFPAVSFEMDTVGAEMMGDLTKNNLKRQMAIVLDGRVYSWPRINGQIRDSGIITGGTGGFSESELNYLLRTLSAGSLQGKLPENPLETRVIEPSLGAENLRLGYQAAFGALIAVMIFMMIYYFFAGGVANAALLANLVIILGIMASLQATFTLPGIAGIVLTIGMCVDANVLIYERIREELATGSDMSTSLRLGYQRAFSSIIDGNMTNLIICFILGYTASADVQGFAVTLGIGICATLFTAMFMTRVIFETYFALVSSKKRKLTMLPTAVPAIHKMLSPSINWIDKRKIFFCISVIAVVGSISMAVSRGSELLSIEFQAGTEVVIDLKDDSRMSRKDIDGVLKDLKEDLPEATPIAVGEADENGKYGSFSIVTTQADTEKVQTKLEEALGAKLAIRPAMVFEGSDQNENQVATLKGKQIFPVEPREGAAVNNDGALPLSAVIPGVNSPVDVSDYKGTGVAILINDLKDPSTGGLIGLKQIEDRIKTMRLKPDFIEQQHRTTRVIELESEEDADGNIGVTRAVILVNDPRFNSSGADTRTTWLNNFAASEWKLIRAALVDKQTFSKVTNFTPTAAETIRDNAIVALILSVLAIVAYIWFRFGSIRYGLAAIVALVHDVSIALGVIALSGIVYTAMPGLAEVILFSPMKISMATIAALLTIIGYSLNDTIVLFDRIRENRGKLAVASPKVINQSINQVISRTVLTSFTTFLAVFIMYAFGGEGIHDFALALVVGVVVGTYSSIAIASPMLLVGTKFAGTRLDDEGDNGGTGELEKSDGEVEGA